MSPVLTVMNGCKSDRPRTKQVTPPLLVAQRKFHAPDSAIYSSGVIIAIYQASSSMVIDWSSYNLSSDEIVNYIQPDNHSFNRIFSNEPSQIYGQINAATGGNVTLLGRQVQNQGVINANLGAVNMAAGKQAVHTLDNQGLIDVSVTKKILQSELGELPLPNTHMRIAA